MSGFLIDWKIPGVSRPQFKSTLSPYPFLPINCSAFVSFLIVDFVEANQRLSHYTYGTDRLKLNIYNCLEYETKIWDISVQNKKSATSVPTQKSATGVSTQKSATCVEN